MKNINLQLQKEFLENDNVELTEQDLQLISVGGASAFNVDNADDAIAHHCGRL